MELPCSLHLICGDLCEIFARSNLRQMIHVLFSRRQMCAALLSYRTKLAERLWHCRLYCSLDVQSWQVRNLNVKSTEPYILSPGATFASRLLRVLPCDHSLRVVHLKKTLLRLWCVKSKAKELTLPKPKLNIGRGAPIANRQMELPSSLYLILWRSLRDLSARSFCEMFAT